jgi:hypothetical protein
MPRVNVVFGGAVIVLTAPSIGIVGDWLRDRLDPTLRQQYRGRKYICHGAKASIESARIRMESTEWPVFCRSPIHT